MKRESNQIAFIIDNTQQTPIKMKQSVRVLIAFDKFKDCMGAEALGNICASALSHLFSSKVCFIYHFLYFHF